MHTARIVVLTFAPGAGGVAAHLARGPDNKSMPAEPAAQLQTVDVLVAKSDIHVVENTTDDQAKHSDSINVVRYGVSSPTTMRKLPEGRTI